MKTAFGFTLLHFVAWAIAAPVDTAQSIPKGVLAFDVDHRVAKAEHLHKRGLYNTSLILSNMLSYYTIDFSVGTPRQPVTALIDTGSSDFWLYDKSSGSPHYFDSEASSTYQSLGTQLRITYGSGPVRGNWAKETIEFANQPLEGATFGLVTSDQLKGSPLPGLLGLGRVENEGSRTPYPNIPVLLYQAGATMKNAYSISLSSFTSSKGSCIFGGLDTSKYTGPLYSMPMSSDPHLAVKLSGISFGDATSEQLENSSAPDALLDTGTSFMYIPDTVVDQIVNQLGAVWYPEYGVHFVPNIDETTPALTFNFSGATITVPVNEYIHPASQYTSNPTPSPYILTVFKASQVQGFVLLGDTFLRSAYVVFDLGGNEIALAQASQSQSSSSSNILPIVSSIPGAVPAPLL